MCQDRSTLQFKKVNPLCFPFLPLLSVGWLPPAEAADWPALLQKPADGVAVGRRCLGNPWIFRQCVALVRQLPDVRPPVPVERGGVLLQLVEGEFQLYGP